jgi:hypothetical protein
MSIVNLTYTNQSDNEASDLLVFTKNVKANLDALPPVAWRVISHIGPHDSNDFIYPIDTALQAVWDITETSRSYTQILAADQGGLYALNLEGTSFELARAGSTLPGEIDLANNVQVAGGITAGLFKDGRLLMQQPNVGFGQKAEFKLNSFLYFGLVQNVVESDVLTSAVMSQSFTAIDVGNGARQVTVTLRGNAKEGYFFETQVST